MNLDRISARLCSGENGQKFRKRNNKKYTLAESFNHPYIGSFPEQKMMGFLVGADLTQETH